MQTLGRYQLLGQLATGGMAEIHLARLAGEAGFEKTVVVKRLLPELVASKAFVAMFLDEGKLVARIDHPNVCEVYELGRDGNEYFLVMPYLDGVPATDFIARPRESDRMAQLRVAAGIVVQACAGLHAAHELRGSDGESLGLVHRDVSPSNLFVTAAGVVKVLDFGVAKVRGGEATEVGTIKGKTQYMAPEQLVGEPLDRRCDVFALGIVLFELATHQRLFKRSSEFLTAKAILEEDIPRADRVDPAVPTALADVIAKALARNRDERYATAKELGAAVAAAMPVASSSEIADALAHWHGEELSALRTRQRAVIDEASHVGTTPVGRSREASQVATQLGRRRRGDSQQGGVAHAADIAPDGPRAGSDTHVGAAAMTAPASSAASPRFSNDNLDGPRGPRAGSVTHVGDAPRAPSSYRLDSPRKRRRAPLLAAVLAGAGGIAVLAFFATRPSPSATSARVVDAQPIDAPIDTPAPVDAAPDAPPVIEQPPIIEPPEPRPVAKPKPGLLSIDSTPFATVFVDDKRLGITPLVKKSLPAGKHRVRAVLKDGRSKELTVDIPAGKLAPPVLLTW